jgi:hypothetical protein
MIEEDLFFPGKVLEDKSDSDDDNHSVSDAGHSQRSTGTFTANPDTHTNGTHSYEDATDTPREPLDDSFSLTMTLQSGDHRHFSDTRSSTVVSESEESFGMDEPQKYSPNSTRPNSRYEDQILDPQATITRKTHEPRPSIDEATELIQNVMVGYEKKHLEKQQSFTKEHSVQRHDQPSNGHTVTTPTQPSFPAEVPTAPASPQASPTLPGMKSKLTESAVSLLLSSVGGGLPPPNIPDIGPLPSPPPIGRGGRPRGYSLGATQQPSEYARVRNGSHPSIFPSTSSPPPPLPKQSKPTNGPLLLRTIPKTPPNPRDHSLLTLIWEEMLSSRFINGSPLALLYSSLILSFKG